MFKSLHDIYSVLTRKEKTTFLFQVFFEVLITLLDVAFLLFLVLLINHFVQKENILWFEISSESSVIILIVFCIAYSIKNYFAYLVNKKQYHFIYRVALRISEERLQRYLTSDYSNYVNVDSSVHSNNIKQQPIEFAHYVLRSLQTIVGQSILISITVVAIIFFDPELFFYLSFIMLPPIILLASLQKRKSRHIRNDIKSASEKATQYLNEAIAGFVENKIFSTNNFFINRYSQRQKDLNTLLAKQQIIQTLPARFIEVFAVYGFAVLVMADRFTNSNLLSITTVGTFMAAAYKIIPGVVKIVNAASSIQTYEFVTRSLKEKGKKEQLMNNERSDANISSIEFKNVSFSYGTREVLKNLSLQINRGDFVGISAPSGKGKTTLINILLGFLNSTTGDVLINNRNISQQQEFIWKKVSYVKQQPFFINDTSIHNTVLSAEYRHEQFDNVAFHTGIFSAENFNTQTITENGKNISGGQRKRLALARALYKDFDVLILDEPFSELDKKAERKLLEELQRLVLNGKMILLITHNSDSLTYCNKIINL